MKLISLLMTLSPRASLIEQYTSGEVLDVGVVQHEIENVSDETWLHRQIYDFDGVSEVLGIDILENEIDSLLSMGYNVETQNAEEMNFDRKFDTIIAGEIIEHLSNPGKFLEKSSQYLRPGGILVITTPNTFNVLRFLFLIRNGYVISNSEHTGWYDEETLNQLASRYGFSLKNTHKTTFNTGQGDLKTKLIRLATPPAWTAETLVAVFEKDNSH